MKKVWGVLLAAVFLFIGFRVQADTLDLGSIVVTPNREAQDAGKASSNVTVIGSYEIEHSNAGTVGDVLKGVPGVKVTNQGSAHSTLVDIGGYADAAVSNVLVLVNGRRTNSMDMSGPDWQQIPVESVERIEVIRGGASVLYGDKAVGGVVNIITKEGSGKNSAALFSEFGSYRSQKYGAEASGGKDRLSYYLYSDYVDTKGYRDNSQVLTKDQQGRLSYKLSDQVKFGFEGGLHREDYGTPFALTGSDLATMERTQTTHPFDYGDTADDYIKLSSELIPGDAEGQYGKFDIDYSHRDRHTYYWMASGSSYYAGKGLIKSDGLTVKHVWKGDLAGHALNTVTGVDHYNDRDHILATGMTGDNLSITKRTLGIYNHLELEVVDHLFLDGGIRREAAQYIFDQYDHPTYTTQHPRLNVYSGGLKYEYAKGSNVFVNAQKTFRFLATDEWYQTYPAPQFNRDLQQQKGVEYQAGVKHNVNDLMELSAMSFLTLNKNEILYDYNSYANTNYPHTRRKGVDLGARFDACKAAGISFLRSWDMMANYTYMDARFYKGGFGSKLMPGVPSHQLSLGTNVGFPGGLSWDLTARWTGSQYMNNDQLNQYPRIKPFTVVDTKLSYKMKINADVYFGVNNLFNEKYNNYTSVGSGPAPDYLPGMPYNYPAPERNYVVGMKYRF
ncbi:MAG: TonB-dependent receptor [Candidatus Omnitrophica bacterium]|nr:TonB-dependent receptor [Candidatus Omnitrophota bacterium]